jgi:hypothetical protein
MAMSGFQQSKASESDEAAAEKAALSWLSLVDESKYPQSWTEAASYFKSAIKKSQWEAQVKAAREPMGKIVSRAVKSKKYATSLPGAPDGEYVVIQFETKFANKSAAVETITPQKDKDGQWRVSGYFIR